MTLYKFKPLNEFEFVADIIINKRLYSTEFTNLNDPMEGIFEYDNHIDATIVRQIIESKQNHKVCALTKGYHNPILWAHYADGFKGICIEVEVDNNIIDLHEISYGPFTPIVVRDRGAKFMGMPQYDPDEWAVTALTRKFNDWAYEEEVRILNSNGTSYIDHGVEIKSIIFGVNTSQIYKDIIAKLVPSNVQVYYSTLDNLSQIVRHPYSLTSRE